MTINTTVKRFTHTVSGDPTPKPRSTALVTRDSDEHTRSFTSINDYPNVSRDQTMADKSSSLKVPSSIQRSIQYTVSPKEYAYLHNRYIKKLSPASRSKLPSPEVYTEAIESRGDFNAATIRASIRAFLAIQAIFKIYDYVIAKLAARKGQRYGQSAALQIWS